MDIRTDPMDALRSIHELLWDEEYGLERTAPGATPGIDLSAFNLHSVRETVMGAFLDLEDGHVSRAERAIHAVLPLQFDAPGTPWNGTFPVAAEQPVPHAGAVEWIDYDPNWRQFLGCLLALINARHGTRLSTAAQNGIRSAIARCVEGEPVDRIPEWYTNPRLMHAWLTAHHGNSAKDTATLTAGEDLARAITARFDAIGELDEYNSPTYDGIDLFALAMWVAHPPTKLFAEAGSALLKQVCARISNLYHPLIGNTCGPYIRCYGVDPQKYVSLNGLWFHLAFGHNARSLPTSLNVDSVHVHDLYFLPVFAALHDSLSPLVRYEVDETRLIVKHFGGAVCASELSPNGMVGWERGRRHDFAFDQYTPFVLHTLTEDGNRYVAVKPGEGARWIDCERTADGFVISVAGDSPCSIRVLSSDAPSLAGSVISFDAALVTLEGHVSSCEPLLNHGGNECRIEFAGESGSLRITTN